MSLCVCMLETLTARSHRSAVSSLACIRNLSENACQHSSPLNALFLSHKKLPLHVSLRRWRKGWSSTREEWVPVPAIPEDLPPFSQEVPRGQGVNNRQVTCMVGYRGFETWQPRVTIWFSDTCDLLYGMVCQKGKTCLSTPNYTDQFLEKPPVLGSQALSR